MEETKKRTRISYKNIVQENTAKKIRVMDEINQNIRKLNKEGKDFTHTNEEIEEMLLNLAKMM